MINGIVIINVDMSSVAGDIFNVPAKIVLKDNFGTTHTNIERSFFDNSRVLWNFHNYDGKIIFQREWMGSILAPAADVQAQSNIDGSIICNLFWNYGETHKWDFNGTIDFSETGDSNEPDTPDVPDQPEDPKPDEPSVPSVPGDNTGEEATEPDTGNEPGTGGETETPDIEVPVNPEEDTTATDTSDKTVADKNTSEVSDTASNDTSKENYTSVSTGDDVSFICSLTLASIAGAGIGTMSRKSAS